MKLHQLLLCIPVLPTSLLAEVSLIQLGETGIANAVSSDGRVVLLGSALWENGNLEYTGMNWFSDVATDVSGDGKAVVGNSSSTAFRWEGGTRTNLSMPEGSNPSTQAWAISADGTVIVGSQKAGITKREAVKWEGETRTPLGRLNENGESNAQDVSGDGSVIVGYAHPPDSLLYEVPFRWENGVMTNLGHPGGTGVLSEALAVSPDGTVIGGSSQYGGIIRAFMWMDGLHTILEHGYEGALESVVVDISSNGDLLVGISGDADDYSEGVIWAKDNGYAPIRLDDFLENAGVARAGFETRVVTGVSDDGSTIVGHGYDPVKQQSYMGFIVRLRALAGWGDYPLHSDGRSADTGTFIGWIDVGDAPWVYVYAIGKYVYLPEENVSQSGGWLWLPN